MLEHKPEYPSDKILVCLATRIWSNSGGNSKENFFYIEDHEGGHFTQSSIKEIVSRIIQGIFMSQPIIDINKIVFVPAIDGFTTFGDGFFKRPLIPSTIWKLKTFPKLKQIIFKMYFLKSQAT